ncbi:uncharacterized protein LACBIDRAFT_142382, partial [Laccaria bicolor S238N-H82]
SPHWQQQLLKCEMIRSARSPHHRARTSAMASRTVAKSAIPITNPNLVKPPLPAELNGTASEVSSPTTSDRPASSPPINGNAVNRPSSTVAAPAEAFRPTSIMKPPENTWSSLDMGGLNIKNLPATSGLFTFTFLINLYLNHNALSSVPPEISKLRHLELLDISGNNLSTLPPEMGMLTQLKELYVFDNHLTVIPFELGSLHQLQTLGVEGNPLDATLKAIIQKDGTPTLISYLRDNCPTPPAPPLRELKVLLTEPELEALAADPNAETFRVLCYNILCERCATERLYGYTPSWALAWEYRKDLILTEIINSGADFLCLQEVDIAAYEDYFTKNLAEHGYEGVYWPKSRSRTMNEADRRQVDGCATFYKADRYQLVEKHLVEFSAVAMQRQDFKKTDDMFNRVLGKEHLAIVSLMEDKVTGTRFVIANAHIHWDPAYCDVKLVQAALLVDEIEKMASHFAKYPPRPPPSASTSSIVQAYRTPPVYTDGTKIPLIICGDFNSIPSSGVYDFLSNGTLPADHVDFKSHKYGRYTSEGLRHRFGLKSAYAAPGAGEPPVTNYVPTFQGHIDYLWYSAANLGVNAILSGVDKDYLEKVVGFPNAHFPSDHVCIVAEFRVK